MKYQLWLWNPWDFGRWISNGFADSIEDLLFSVRNRPSITYKITDEDGKIIQYKTASGCYWRYGMVSPRIK